MRHWIKKNNRNLVSITISLIITTLLINSIDWAKAFAIFSQEVSGKVLVQFFLVTSAIAFFYGYRWRLLLDLLLTHRMSLISSIIAFGGNMFLPVRGGDILCIHYSHLATQIPHAKLVSRLFVEKVIDAAGITAIGTPTTIGLREQHASAGHTILAILTAIALATVFVVTFLIKYFDVTLLRWLYSIFCLAGKSAFFERHVVHLVHDASLSLTARTLTLPVIVTLIIWLSVYALSYMLAARFVGVTLPYTQSLFVLFAGALGLMLLPHHQVLKPSTHQLYPLSLSSTVPQLKAC